MKSKYFHPSLSHIPIRMVTCAVLAGVLAGCVFKRTPIQVTLAPKVNQPLASEPKASLQLGRFKDSRLVTDEFVLLQKENGFGPTEGAYVTEKPVAEILRDGLMVALEQNGFRLTNGAQYELRGDLQSSGYVPVQGAFTIRQIKLWLTVRFDLVNPATGLTVWHDIYTGQGTATNLNLATKKFVTSTCTNMLENAISQLVSDRMFRSYFETRATNAP